MTRKIVYDPYFGNTEKIAQEIGKTFRDNVSVTRPRNVQTEVLAELDFLIVGSSTRAFRPSDTIKTFLKYISSGALEGVRVAKFYKNGPR